MRNFALLICALGISCAALAQPNHDWANLARLTPGQKIQITDTSHQTHFGTFASVTESAISYNSGAGAQSLPRESVKRVKLENYNHRLRNSLIGGAIGAGATGGIVAGVWETHGFVGGKATGFGIGAGLGGLVGLAVGAFWPSHDTIYRATSH